MKKLILIIAAVALSHSIVYTQGCLPEGITFTTQAQIDSFQINFSDCSEIEGDVNIGDLSGNDISNLNGLTAISSIWGNLIIVYNPNLTSLTGLENLTSIGVGLTINNNLVLTSLSGLYNLDTIHGYFYFAANSNLFNLTGLESLTYIGGKVTFGDTDGYGTSLTSLAGLEGLTYIGGGLDLEHNPSLTSLEGLEGLNTIIGELTIGNCWDQSNYNLSSLVGLENINAGTISNLSITCNPLLSICDVQSICDYLAAPGGTIEIHDNAPGCNSPGEVEEACETVSIGEISFCEVLTIHPNPFSTSTTIEYELSKPSTVQLTIYDYLGRLIEVIEKKQSQGKQQIIWNAEGLPAGVYVVELRAKGEGHRAVSKLVVP